MIWLLGGWVSSSEGLLDDLRPESVLALDLKVDMIKS